MVFGNGVPFSCSFYERKVTLWVVFRSFRL
jgi:hypothetical protein